MTKEILQEDLVKRSASAASVEGDGINGNNGWDEVVGVDNIYSVSWTLILTVGLIGCVVCLTCATCICCCFRNNNNASKKKRTGAAAKKTGYFRAKMCPTKPARNPPPVTNPDKGAHYLKKSPSPTGAKSPPGGNCPPMLSSPANTAEEYLQRKALITCQQQSLQQRSSVLDLIPSATANDSMHLQAVSNQNSRRASCPAPATLLQQQQNSMLGRLRCTVKYCFEKNALVVTINTCENLPAKDVANKSSDPYVKLQLLPEKQHKVKTRVMRRTLNPVYDEDFTFYGVNFNQLPGLTLHFVVLSFDRYSRDDVIGEVMVDLDSLDLSSSDHQPLALVREITPRSLKLKAQGRGEILVSLCYQPAANRVTAVVLKARNLPKMDITGLSDPYVKIYLLYNDQRIAKKKTHVKKRTLNPVFNESFVFDLPNLGNVGGGDEEGLKNISLEFLLLDWDRVTKNEVIGRLDLGGANCSGSALHHWNEVIASPRRQIAEWHKLQE